MLPADWEEYVAGLERRIKRAPSPTKRHQPRIKRMESPRMRRVSGQTRNPVKAMYSTESAGAMTPVAPANAEFTSDLGGNCEDRNSPTGKKTQ